jgi:hypothetical protein
MNRKEQTMNYDVTTSEIGRKFALVAGVACFALATGAATWTGGGDGVRWNDPANWGGAVPGAGGGRDDCVGGFAACGVQ